MATPCLAASAVAASGRADELAVRPLTSPRLVSVLCLAVSAHKRLTPLGRETAARLVALAKERVAAPAARPAARKSASRSVR